MNPCLTLGLTAGKVTERDMTVRAPFSVLPLYQYLNSSRTGLKTSKALQGWSRPLA